MHGGAVAQTPMEVMSDTASYCTQLEAQLTGLMASAPTSDEVKFLAETGHRLCHEGEIRAGIARLRRALVSLHSVQSQLPTQTSRALPP
jgi:hypothetical protein